jgi:hypothetical protein
VLPEPPSRAWWEWDSLVRGHTVSETIEYASWVSDYEDQQQTRRRALPSNVISPDGIEPRAIGFLRRLFNR